MRVMILSACNLGNGEIPAGAVVDIEPDMARPMVARGLGAMVADDVPLNDGKAVDVAAAEPLPPVGDLHQHEA